jgi:hypothetical protein
MMDAQGPRAFTIRQLERAWKTWGLDAAKLKIMVTEVHPLTGLTGLLDSREPRFDGVPGAAMSAALARSPRVIIAFGAYTRARWLRDTRNLPGVTSAVLVAPSLETEVQEESAMIVTMTDQSQVKVLFAPHPSAFFLFDGVLAAVADAHGVEYDRATLAATARSRSHLLSVEKVAGGQFVAVEVDTPDSRFLLSDGALTHNCATGIAFTAAFKVFTGSIPE